MLTCLKCEVEMNLLWTDQMQCPKCCRIYTFKNPTEQAPMTIYVKPSLNETPVQELVEVIKDLMEYMEEPCDSCRRGGDTYNKEYTHKAKEILDKYQE